MNEDTNVIIGPQSIFDLANIGDINGLKSILEIDSSLINRVDEKGNSALHWASYR